MRISKVKARISCLIAALMMVSPAFAQSIALHVDKNCKGPALSTTVGNSDVNYPVDSIRVRSGEWEVCRDKDFHHCVEVTKTGCSDLNEIQFWGQVRSVRPMAAAAPEAEAIIYRDRDFSGPAVFIKNEKTDMDWMGHGISSIRVKKGRWQACSEPNFAGSCRLITKDTPSIAAIQLPEIGSIRPAPAIEGPKPVLTLHLARKCKGPGRSKHSSDGDINYPTRSINISTGWWEICSKENFGGICKKISAGCTESKDFGFIAQLRSARPVVVENQKPQPK
ncbi:MAG: beta/gamma crystallin-related protein [Parvularculaceae bacterium]